MIKRNSKPLRDILADFFSDNPRLKTQRAEHRAVKAWHELLGKGVSLYTKNIYFRRNILYVQLTSAVLRAELLLNKENLIERINEYAGMDIVRDIVLR